MENEFKQKYYDCLNSSEHYKNNKNLYLFLKDCAFRWISNVMNNPNVINPNEKNMINQTYSQFQSESNQMNWNFNNMNLNEYSQFLEQFYNTLNFDSCEIQMLSIAKTLTENQKFFGNLNDLAQNRLNFINNRINQKMNNNNNNNRNYFNNSNNFNMNSNGAIQSGNFSVSHVDNNNNNMNNNNYNNNNYNNNNNNNNYNNNNYNNNNNNFNNNNNNFNNNNNNFNNNNNNFNNNNNYNNNNIQNNYSQPFSDSQLTDNTNIGTFYDPTIVKNYVPKLVNPMFKLPMSKTDMNYPQLKEVINMHIEYSNLELDYHKINKAREHLEAAAFYLSNIIN